MLMRSSTTRVARGVRPYPQVKPHATTMGLWMLILRHLVQETDGLYRASDTEHNMLRYYANSIAPFLPKP